MYYGVHSMLLSKWNFMQVANMNVLEEGNIVNRTLLCVEQVQA